MSDTKHYRTSDSATYANATVRGGAMSDPEAEARKIIRDADGRRPILETAIAAALRARDEEIERLRMRAEKADRMCQNARHAADAAVVRANEAEGERDEARVEIERIQARLERPEEYGRWQMVPELLDLRRLAWDGWIEVERLRGQPTDRGKA